MKKKLFPKFLAGMVSCLLFLSALPSYAADDPLLSLEGDTDSETLPSGLIDPVKPETESSFFETVTYETETTEAPEGDFPLDLTPGRIVTNVSLEGVSLQGMTREDVLELMTEMSRSYLRTEVRITSSEGDCNAELSALGAALNVNRSVSEVFPAVDRAIIPEGTLLERYRFAKDYQWSPVELSLTYTLDESEAISFLTDALAFWKTEPVNAELSVENGEIGILKESSPGKTFSFQSGVEALKEAMESGQLSAQDGFEFAAEEETVEPDVATEDLENYRVIGTYTTKYPAADSVTAANREQNLVVSAANMNGSSFEPGERISALTMYGDVTEANGYRAAGTIIGGSHIDQVGGGICQTTTTLYNAVLMAELNVIYRSNHSMIVTYVTPSRDAMVYYAGWDHESNQYDFVFENSTSGTLYINSYVNKADCTITVNLIGIEEHDEGHEVRYESEILSKSAPGIANVVDASIENTDAPNAKLYYQLGLNSPLPQLTSRLWKVVYENGVEVSRTLVNSLAHYKPQAATLAVAPGVHVTAICTDVLETGYISYHVEKDPVVPDEPEKPEKEKKKKK